MSESTILVTGGTGYIGSHLVTALVQAGATVYVMTRYAPTQERLETVKYICADLLDMESLNNQIQQVDLIYYLACEDFSKIEYIKPEETVAYQGMVNLFTVYAKSIKKFIYVSSVKALGETTDGMAQESDRPRPTSLYGKVKLKAEQFLNTQITLAGAPQIHILRFPVVYGVEEHGSIHALIAKVLSHKYIPIPNVTNRRSMLFIDNAVEALISTGLKQSGEVLFFVSDDCSYSTSQLIEMIAKAFSRKVYLIKIPIIVFRALIGFARIVSSLRHGKASINRDLYKKLTTDALYSNDSIKTALGYRPKKCFAEVLPLIVEKHNHA